MKKTSNDAARRAQRRTGASAEPAAIAADLDGMRDLSVDVDRALDALFEALAALETAADKFTADRQADIDIRQVQPALWGGYVHERLMQEAGAFGRHLQNVHNVPSAPARPVARWVPPPSEISRHRAGKPTQSLHPGDETP